MSAPGSTSENVRPSCGSKCPAPAFDLDGRVGRRPLDHLGRQRGDEVAEAVDVNHLPLDHAVAPVQRRRAQLHHRLQGRAGVRGGGAGGQPAGGRREHVAAVKGRADRLAPKAGRLDPVDLPRPARRPATARRCRDRRRSCRRRRRPDRRARPPTPGSTTATWMVPGGNSGAACASATAPAATSRAGTPCAMSTSVACGASDRTTPLSAPT